jgi:hypothetical protein
MILLLRVCSLVCIRTDASLFHTVSTSPPVLNPITPVAPLMLFFLCSPSVPSTSPAPEKSWTSRFDVWPLSSSDSFDVQKREAWWCDKRFFFVTSTVKYQVTLVWHDPGTKSSFTFQFSWKNNPDKTGPELVSHYNEQISTYSCVSTCEKKHTH